MKVHWLLFSTAQGWVHCACFLNLVGSAYGGDREAGKALAPWRTEQNLLWVGVLASNCEARA